MSLTTRINDLKKEVQTILDSIKKTEQDTVEAQAAQVLAQQNLVKTVGADVAKNYTPTGLAVDNPFDTTPVFTTQQVTTALASIFKI